MRYPLCLHCHKLCTGPNMIVSSSPGKPNPPEINEVVYCDSLCWLKYFKFKGPFIERLSELDDIADKIIEDTNKEPDIEISALLKKASNKIIEALPFLGEASQLKFNRKDV